MVGDRGDDIVGFVHWLAPHNRCSGVGLALAVEIDAGLVVGLVNVGDAFVVADELGEDDVVENGDDDRLQIRDPIGDRENRMFDEELGEDRLQKFLAVDVFCFFCLAKREERHDGVKTVGRGARGHVCSAKNVFFGSRRGDFAFRHFSSKAKKSLAAPVLGFSAQLAFHARQCAVTALFAAGAAPQALKKTPRSHGPHMYWKM